MIGSTPGAGARPCLPGVSAAAAAAGCREGAAEVRKKREEEQAPHSTFLTASKKPGRSACAASSLSAAGGPGQQRAERLVEWWLSREVQRVKQSLRAPTLPAVERVAEGRRGQGQVMLRVCHPPTLPPSPRILLLRQRPSSPALTRGD